eukprot:TRINITY_DN122_c0_g1_i9.p1 TRINITY_DN122_c0_g1~~TRINITY_DN122_c0_g1_i9.p1  ORF type:complete len:236 (+),score=75.12 TRINITY_DN122_c0_g1_i9:56-763(+)
MSTMRMTVMLSMAALSAGASCGSIVGQPLLCAEVPGCMVYGMDCVEAPSVWLQHPNGSPADEQVHGDPVAGSSGGRWTFNVGPSEWVEKFPEFLGKTTFHSVTAVEAQGGLRFVCPEKEMPGQCDFLIAVFTCAPCSDSINGGLPKLLTVSHGWEARSCAPVLREVDYAEDFKMTLFRTSVPSGYSAETPRFLTDAHYLAVFSSMEPVDLCPVPTRPRGPFPDGNHCSKACPFDV